MCPRLVIYIYASWHPYREQLEHCCHRHAPAVVSDPVEAVVDLSGEDVGVVGAMAEARTRRDPGWHPPGESRVAAGVAAALAAAAEDNCIGIGIGTAVGPDEEAAQPDRVWEETAASAAEPGAEGASCSPPQPGQPRPPRLRCRCWPATPSRPRLPSNIPGFAVALVVPIPGALAAAVVHTLLVPCSRWCCRWPQTVVPVHWEAAMAVVVPLVSAATPMPLVVQPSRTPILHREIFLDGVVVVVVCPLTWQSVAPKHAWFPCPPPLLPWLPMLPLLVPLPHAAFLAAGSDR